jgi:hypothetical protein
MKLVQQEENRVELRDLQELFKHPGWQVYLDTIEDTMVYHFQEMFGLDPSKPESFIKFVELKSKIDQLRNVTYFTERELAEDKVDEVDTSYTTRFRGLLKRLLRS